MTSWSEHRMKGSGWVKAHKHLGKRGVGVQVGERRWQVWDPGRSKKKRVGRRRTFCASHKHQEVNAQEGPASERTRDKNVTMNEIT